jgi:hypothetical protein
MRKQRSPLWRSLNEPEPKVRFHQRTVRRDDVEIARADVVDDGSLNANVGAVGVHQVSRAGRDLRLHSVLVDVVGKLSTRHHIRTAKTAGRSLAGRRSLRISGVGPKAAYLVRVSSRGWQRRRTRYDRNASRSSGR